MDTIIASSTDLTNRTRYTIFNFILFYVIVWKENVILYRSIWKEWRPMLLLFFCSKWHLTWIHLPLNCGRWRGYYIILVTDIEKRPSVLSLMLWHDFSFESDGMNRHHHYINDVKRSRSPNWKRLLEMSATDE